MGTRTRGLTPQSISKLGNNYIMRFQRAVEDLAFIGAQQPEDHKRIRQAYFSSYGQLVRYIADLERDVPKVKKDD